MAQITLDKQISIDELQQIIKNGYPNYFIARKGNNLVIDAGFQGKYVVLLFGKILWCNPKTPVILEIIISATIIGAIFLLRQYKNNPVANEILNYVKLNCGTNIVNADKLSIIPNTCPHCKSPNLKKIRLCEWCGNQIA